MLSRYRCTVSNSKVLSDVFKSDDPFNNSSISILGGFHVQITIILGKQIM